VCEGNTVVGTGDGNLLDDFEDGNLILPPNDGRSGDWSSYSDGTGTLDPDIESAAIGDGVDGSTMAANMAGTGFQSWGAGFGPIFNGVGCYDASVYEGVSFAAKGSGYLRFAVTTAEIHESFDCDADVEECSNYYHAPDIVLTDAWVVHEFTWDELAQPGWGPAKPLSLDKMVGLSFAHLADLPEGGPDFDLWIDDVRFLGGTP
jgi:hypothetical protein